MRSDIEFVDAEPPAPDDSTDGPTDGSSDGSSDDVAAPARRIPPRAVVLAAAAVLALLVTGVIVHHHASRTAVPAARATSPAPVRHRVDAFHVTPGLPDWASLPRTFGLDGAHTDTIDGTPAGVREAVQAALPGWRIVDTQTVTTRLTVAGQQHSPSFDLGDADVQARLITLRSGGAQVLVRIVRRTTPRDEPPKTILPGGPGQTSDFTRLETAGYIVDVEWIGAQTLRSPGDGLTLLINDPNLLATS